jgi:hypothetical protein
MSRHEVDALNLDAVAYDNAADPRSPRTIRSGRPLDSLTNTRSGTAPESPSHARSERAALFGPELLTYARSERAA